MREGTSDTDRLKQAVKVSAYVAATLLIVAVAVTLAIRYEDEPDAVVEQTVLISVVPQTVAALPELNFTDITQAAGIDFVHENGATGDRFLPETMGGGLALFDFDVDGDLDLLFVNSEPWKTADSEIAKARSRLYENDGLGQFTDISESHLNLALYGMSPAIGDVNGDGYPDLFVTAVGQNKLFINRAGRKFEDSTESYQAGGESGAFSSCATFFDYDRDDDLDLFVCNYVNWSQEIDRAVDFRLTGVGRAYGPPTDFPGTTSWLYRNDGERFVDVTAEAGIAVVSEQTGAPIGKALAVSILDINGDGWQDALVANDTVRNFLFINNGDGTFSERGVEYGVAFDPSGSATGAMGLDVANYDNDAKLGLAIGNFANEMSSFYVGDSGSEVFSDDAIVVGIGAATRKVLTFGLFFFDVDLDGRVDLFSANGHIEPEISSVQASQSYAQQPQLFWNCGHDCPRTYQPVPTVNTALHDASVARGAAYGDLDGDGDLDIVVTNVGGMPRVIRNDIQTSNRWLTIGLHYRGGNRFGIGSVVRLIGENATQTRYVTRTRSYLAQFDVSAHFGLGSESEFTTLEITWPNGEGDIYPVTETNTRMTIEYMPRDAEM